MYLHLLAHSIYIHGSMSFGRSFLKLKSGLKFLSVDTQFTHFCSFYIDVCNLSLLPFHSLQNSFLAFFFSLGYLPGFLHLHPVNHITNTLDLLDAIHTLYLMVCSDRKEIQVDNTAVSH